MIALGLLAALLSQPPQRVVSLNLCTDQLAMALARPGTLKAISFLSDDPVLSLNRREAQGYPHLQANAESLLPLKPDLVLLAQGQDGYLQQWLTDHGIPLFTQGFATSVEQVQEQVREMGRMLGNPSAAEAIIATQDRALGRAARKHRPLRVAVYHPRGFTEGAGTLLNDVISRVGGENVVAPYGRQGLRLPLESLVALAPDIILVPDYAYGVKTEGERLTRHAALEKAGAETVAVPGAYIACPHLSLAPLAALLGEAMDSAGEAE